MKKLLSIIIIFFLTSFLSGCGKPVYYSDEEILNYVKETYGEDIKYINKETIDKNNKHEYIYTFKGKDNILFTVRSCSVISNSAGWDTYVKFKECNYKERIIEELYMEDIMKMIADSDVQIISEHTEINNPYMKIHIGEYTNIYKIGKALEKIDKLLDSENAPVNCIDIYCYGLEDDYFLIDRIETSEEVIKEEDVIKQLEKALVERELRAIENGYIELGLSEEILDKYSLYEN